MAAKTLPTNAGQLIGLGNKMETGMVKVGASVPVTMVTETQVATDLQSFVTAEETFNAARSAAQTKSDIYQAALQAVYVWLLAARSVLVPKFGSRWNTAWAQAGFVNHSTAVPSRIEERLALVLSLFAFFRANKPYEVPSLEVTAAVAAAKRGAALEAQSELADEEMLLKEAGETRATAQTTLMATMRTLISNLDRKLTPFDPRWLAFGLTQPGVSQTPGKPVNVQAHTDGTGDTIVTCDQVPLAARYRWRMLLVGVQTEYALAARSVDPIGMIKNVLPGQRVRIIVQAVNGNRQGVASDPIEFTMPLLEAARETPAPKAESMSIVSATNGSSSNGHANGRRPTTRLA